MKDELPSTIGQGTTVFLASVGNSSSNGNNYSIRNQSRGFYRGRRGGRGRGGRGSRNFNYSGAKRKFKGETSDLNENVFETPEESNDTIQFTRTVEAIERDEIKTYSTIKFKDLFTKFNDPTLDPPKDLKKGATNTEKRIHDLSLQV